MESRRIYRGVEEAAETGRFRDADFPHSPLSKALRRMYRELRDSERLMGLELLSLSALYGNGSAKLDEGNKARHNLLGEIRSSIPYLAKVYGHGDRDYAIKMYEAMMRKLDEKSGESSGEAGERDGT